MLTVLLKFPLYLSAFCKGAQAISSLHVMKSKCLLQATIAYVFIDFCDLKTSNPATEKKALGRSAGSTCHS